MLIPVKKHAKLEIFLSYKIKAQLPKCCYRLWLVLPLFDYHRFYCGSQTLRVMKFWCISEYGQWNLLTTSHAAPKSKIIPWTKHIWIILSLWFMLIIFRNKSRHSIKQGYVRCSKEMAQLLIRHEFKSGLAAVWNFASDNVIISSIKI